MNTPFRRALGAFVVLAISGCGSSTSNAPFPHSNYPSGASPTPTPAAAAAATKTVGVTGAAQSVALTDAAGNAVTVNLPAASGSVPAGTTVTVSVSQTAPPGAPASKTRHAQSTHRPLASPACPVTTSEFLSITASASYSWSAGPSFTISSNNGPFCAGTYYVQFGPANGPFDILGDASIQGTTLTYNGPTVPLPLAAGQTYIMDVTLLQASPLAVSPSTLTIPSGTAQQLTVTDSFGDPFTVAQSPSSSPALLTFSAPTNGVYTVTAASGITTPTSTTILVTDTAVGATATVPVTITPVNSSTVTIQLDTTSPQALPSAGGWSGAFTVGGNGTSGGPSGSTTPTLSFSVTATNSLPSGVPAPAAGSPVYGQPLYVLQATPSNVPIDIPIHSTIMVTAPSLMAVYPVYTDLQLGVYIEGNWLPLGAPVYPNGSSSTTFIFTTTTDTFDPVPGTFTFVVFGGA